jgi:hypothetical protein
MSDETDDEKRLKALAALMAGAKAGDPDSIRGLEEVKWLPGFDELIKGLELWEKHRPASDTIH